ncbi:MAG: PA2779 family protein, partial [Candidatus Omnitrophica bacterium]|nr:PA2779 family protein [Candidatus Omnitrophota bacterium]
LEKVKLFLDKEIVAKKLSRMSVDRLELIKRVEKLDKEQLHELAMRCDKIKVGGSAGGLLLIVFIIGLVIITILYFTNYTIKVQPRDAIPRRY